MSIYREFEKSPFQGKPGEIYHFFRGSEDWCYTSGKRNIVFEGNTFIPTSIKRTDPQSGGSDAVGQITVTMPTDTALGLALKAGAPASSVQLRIIRYHRPHLSSPAIIFVGEVASTDCQGDVAVLTCDPPTAQLTLPIPRGLIQKEHCVWSFTDPFTCKVNPATFTFNGSVSVIDGLWVTVPGAQDFGFTAVPGIEFTDFFTFGVLTRGEHKGMIEEQDGDSVRLIEILPSLVVGDAVSLLAGDDRTLQTCRNKFGNQLRRLAFRDAPVTNPFYGRGLETH